MRRVAKIILLVVFILLIIVNIPGVALNFMVPIPDEAKNDSVCFLTPELTWNSTISDVRDLFGESSETVSEEVDVIIGRVKRDTFSTVFENHPVKVRTTRNAFSPFTLFRRKIVYEYVFTIKCNSEQDEKKVFDNLCEQLIESRTKDDHFYYNKEGSILNASTYYGPLWLEAGVKYEIGREAGSADEVIFKIGSVFDL